MVIREQLYQELDTVLTPHQSCDFVSSVYRSVSNTHLLDGYNRGYTFDTATIHDRYVTIQVMGKSHPDTWGKATLIHTYSMIVTCKQLTNILCANIAHA